MEKKKKIYKVATTTAGKKRRVLNARPDNPDLRDYFYQPPLIQLAREIPPPAYKAYPILDQGDEGACTGFALAAVVNLLHLKARHPFRASPRMLYEMACKHDEWPGEDYEGSSCRGAIAGWKNMGVCSERAWPWSAKKAGRLTVARAKDARAQTLGAYCRLHPDITHYHAALNEVQALFVSADVHAGWDEPKKLRPGDALATIKPHPDRTGGHAFAVVGYNAVGFIVQNSWGKSWGTGGFAVWLYEDWLQAVNDGWVFRLAVPTPQIFGLAARSRTGLAQGRGRVPKRLEIAGHFVHFDDGKLKPRGPYWSTPDDIVQTAELIRERVSADKYRHLMIYVHGGLNSPEAAAMRIAALRDGHKRNGIYPFHIVYDTGLGEEIGDSLLRASRRAEGLADRLQERIVDFSDKVMEAAVRAPVTAIWDEIKRGAREPFVNTSPQSPGDGVFVIKTLGEMLRATGLKIHLVGHSTGAVLIGHLLQALDTLGMPDLISSCSLLAPACTIEFYQEHYLPRLGKGKKKDISDRTRLPVVDIYNLSAELELADNVAQVYRKSLLYLVSNALERQPQKPLLGMAAFASQIEAGPGLNIHYSDGKTGHVTRSTSHGGFDNDAVTMNSVSTRILGHVPAKPFTPEEMQGY